MERSRQHRTLIAAGLALSLALAVTPTTQAAPAGPAQSQNKDCSRDSTGLVPLNDLGTGTYQGVQGGLYGGGSNQAPWAHALDGRRIANAIAPSDTLGASNNAGGRVVMVSLGGNTANLNFAAFMVRVAADSSRNPNLFLVNGAAGGYDLSAAADPLSSYWDTVATRLRGAGSSPAQVQVAWMSFEVDASLGDFATSTDSTARLLTRAIRNARARLPNLRQLYLTPGIYSGYDDNPARTEPNSYWTGFAARQVILSQVSGDSLNYDASRGAVVAPWIDWGPYLWADGMVPRSDGLTWSCAAYTGNGNVPSQAGRGQFSDSLLAFVRTTAAYASWYRSQSTLDVPGANGPMVPIAALRVSPNPAWAAARLSVRGVEGAWTLRLLDVQGRTRRQFSGDGPADLAWDLRDGDGARMRSGIYWAQVRTSAGSFSRAIVVR